ncbi:hypothetical protein BT69DRAFT_1330811 [Atractiella rhizophila]|nr:hypothetical protein BT69DRAFT_1330811 [Atractiella rhizophila]
MPISSPLRPPLSPQKQTTLVSRILATPASATQLTTTLHANLFGQVTAPPVYENPRPTTAPIHSKTTALAPTPPVIRTGTQLTKKQIAASTLSPSPSLHPQRREGGETVLRRACLFPSPACLLTALRLHPTLLIMPLRVLQGSGSGWNGCLSLGILRQQSKRSVPTLENTMRGIANTGVGVICCIPASLITANNDHSWSISAAIQQHNASANLLYPYNPAT